MNDTKDDIRTALEAIANIRESVRGNIQLVRPLFIDSSFIPLCIAGSIGSAVLAGIRLAFTLIWQNTNVPAWAAAAFWILCVALIAGCSVWKMISFDRAARYRDKTMNMLRIAQLPEVANLLADCWISLITFIVICFAAGYRFGSWWVFFPGCYIYLGFILFLAGGKYGIAEYRAMGIISYALAIVLIIFIKSQYGLWFLGTLSLYFAGFALLLYFSEKRREQKK